MPQIQTPWKRTATQSYFGDTLPGQLASVSGKIGAGPQNAFSAATRNGLQQTALSRLRSTQNATNAGLAQANAARGTTGINAGAVMAGQNSAANRAALAQLGLNTELQGQQLGLDQYGAMTQALGQMGGMADANAGRELQMIGMGLDPNTMQGYQGAGTFQQLTEMLGLGLDPATGKLASSPQTFQQGQQQAATAQGWAGMGFNDTGTARRSTLSIQDQLQSLMQGIGANGQYNPSTAQSAAHAQALADISQGSRGLDIQRELGLGSQTIQSQGQEIDRILQMLGMGLDPTKTTPTRAGTLPIDAYLQQQQINNANANDKAQRDLQLRLQGIDPATGNRVGESQWDIGSYLQNQQIKNQATQATNRQNYDYRSIGLDPSTFSRVGQGQMNTQDYLAALVAGVNPSTTAGGAWSAAASPMTWNQRNSANQWAIDNGTVYNPATGQYENVNSTTDPQSLANRLALMEAGLKFGPNDSLQTFLYGADGKSYSPATYGQINDQRNRLSDMANLLTQVGMDSGMLNAIQFGSGANAGQWRYAPTATTMQNQINSLYSQLGTGNVFNTANPWQTEGGSIPFDQVTQYLHNLWLENQPKA